MAAAMRCLASGMWSGSLAPGAHRLRAASLLPSIAGKILQQQGGAATRLRVLSSAQPYWADEKKDKVAVYSNYCVYKGKAAMALKVIKPTWDNVSSGLRIAREGTVLLEFANAQGPQKYDWEQKLTIALSAIECATVLEATDRQVECSFFHDPNKGGSGEGSVQKSLKIMPGQQSGWFFGLTVKQNSASSSISCNVSDAELRLIKTLLTYLMPRLLGFDEHFQGVPSTTSSADSGSAASAETAGAPF